MIELIAKKGRISVRLRALHMGNDMCILIDGGDTPHIGALTLASNDATSATQTFCLEGHCEGEISNCVAQKVQKACTCTTICACGVHVNNITKKEIADVLQMINTLTTQLIEKI